MSESSTTQTRPTGDRRQELERIKAATWPEEGKDEAIASAVAAIETLQAPPYEFDAQTWKHLAESPGVYEDEE